MVAEGERDRDVGGRGQGRADGESAAREAHVDAKLVREGEALEVLRVGAEVQPRGESGGGRIRERGHQLPVRRGGDQPVDRKTVGVLVDEWRVGVELHSPIPDRVGELAEPVGPRVQEGDAHGRAGGLIARKAPALTEQLVTGMRQRAADHPDAGRERGLELRRGVDQRTGGVALVEDLPHFIGRGHQPGSCHLAGRSNPRPDRGEVTVCGLERRTGIEPASSPWKGEALPLSYRRTREPATPGGSPTVTVSTNDVALRHLPEDLLPAAVPNPLGDVERLLVHVVEFQDHRIDFAAIDTRVSPKELD